MARTKDVVLAPEQKELMEKEYLDFVKPSTYGNKDNPSSCNSLYDDVENPELRAIVEKVAATTPYREETSPNEAQSPPNPLKRISGKQRKATLEEYQQTFLQVPRIDPGQQGLALSDDTEYVLSFSAQANEAENQGKRKDDGCNIIETCCCSLLS